jgi:alginate O-acetyltransferase complex protein AlgI
MIFNSYEFAILLAVVFPLYLLLARWRRQNILLLAASYAFYGWWDYRLVPLLVVSTLTDFFVAKAMEGNSNPRARKALVGLSCAVNLGMLGFFKYGGFFARTANGIGHWLGMEDALMPSLHVILPIGISFYTFQTLAYTVDVYRGRLPACRSLSDFFLYVSFFPQLVAGPIERPDRLLPQIQSKRTVTARDVEIGVFLFATGWLRKAMGDAMGGVTDPVFLDPGGHVSWELMWALNAFMFQLYLDFSGYTNMARGVARMLGFNLMVNFNAPFFVSNIADFWERWHISLSSWLRDYIFIPLGGSRRSRPRVLFNVFLTFFLGGLWHGADWTYAIWGMFWGLYLAGYVYLRPIMGWGKVKPAGERNVKEWVFFVLGALLNFELHSLSLTFFRAQPVGDRGALAISADIAQGLMGFFSDPWVAPPLVAWMVALILIFDVFIERTGSHHWVQKQRWWIRGAVTAALIGLAFIIDSGSSQAFIYFQF